MMKFLFCYLFFFSSRRRHTRWVSDWSSDVCSSDLPGVQPRAIGTLVGGVGPREQGSVAPEQPGQGRGSAGSSHQNRRRSETSTCWSASNSSTHLPAPIATVDSGS